MNDDPLRQKLAEASRALQTAWEHASREQYGAMAKRLDAVAETLHSIRTEPIQLLVHDMSANTCATPDGTRNDGATAAAQVSTSTILDVLRRTAETAICEYGIEPGVVRAVVREQIESVQLEQRRATGTARVLDALSPGPLTRTPEIIDLARRLYDLAGDLARDGQLP